MNHSPRNALTSLMTGTLLSLTAVFCAGSAFADAPLLSPKPVYVLNGANMNLLGEREPELYGRETLADVKEMAEEAGKAVGLKVEFRQTNSEAQMIDWIHEARNNASGIVINPAGFTSTSISIMDALKAFDYPVFEVHMTALFLREDFRQLSYPSKAATAKIEGYGSEGYTFSIERLATLIKEGKTSRNPL